MAHLDLTVEYRTRLAITTAKVAYYATRWCAGPKIAGALAWRTAFRLVRWRIGKGPWQWGLPANA